MRRRKRLPRDTKIEIARLKNAIDDEIVLYKNTRRYAKNDEGARLGRMIVKLAKLTKRSVEAVETEHWDSIN